MCAVSHTPGWRLQWVCVTKVTTDCKCICLTFPAGIPQEDIIQVLQQYRKHRIQLIHTAIVLPPALSAERDDTEELANSTRRGPWFWLRHLKLLLSLNGEDLLTWRAQVDNTSVGTLQLHST